MERGEGRSLDRPFMPSWTFFMYHFFFFLLKIITTYLTFSNFTTTLEDDNGVPI
jgi:hypothetical protein